MNTAKACQHMHSGELTQFELCKEIYTSGILQKVKLAPTTKLVLMALANHYNPNNADMFPSKEYIAKHLGVSVRSVGSAIVELKNKGLVMYEAKRVNRYKFTNIFFNLIISSSDEQLKQNHQPEATKHSHLVGKNEGQTHADSACKQITEQKNKKGTFNKKYSSTNRNYQQNRNNVRSLVKQILTILKEHYQKSKPNLSF